VRFLTDTSKFFNGPVKTGSGVVAVGPSQALVKRGDQTLGGAVQRPADNGDNSGQDDGGAGQSDRRPANV